MRIDRVSAGERDRDRVDGEVSQREVGLDRASPQRRQVRLPAPVGRDHAPRAELLGELEGMPVACPCKVHRGAPGIAHDDEVEIREGTSEKRVADGPADQPGIVCGEDFACQPELRGALEGLLDHPSYRRGTRLAISNFGEKMFHICKNGERMGILTFLPKNPHDLESWIGLFVIHKDHEGKGLGSEVLGLFEDELKKAKKIHKVRLGVQKGNTKGAAFWSKNGFAIIRSSVDEYGNRVDVYEKQL